MTISVRPGGRVIEALDVDDQKYRQLALFPADRGVPEHAKGYGVQVRLECMELHRPRQWGACWLAYQLYEQLELDRFWASRLPNSREGTSWQHILQTLVCYRLMHAVKSSPDCAATPNRLRAEVQSPQSR